MAPVEFQSLIAGLSLGVAAALALVMLGLSYGREKRKRG